MNKFRPVLAALFAVALMIPFTGCLDHESANLTTTAGQPAATVDNSTNIAKGQIVTSTNTSSGTTVGTITGVNLTLVPAPTGTGTVTATFKNTLAMQWANDQTKLVAYGQTIASQLQLILPQLAAAAGDVATISSLVQKSTSAAGLTPVTASQSSVYTAIANGTAKASTDIGILENFLTGLQTTGTVTTATSALLPKIGRFEFALND